MGRVARVLQKHPRKSHHLSEVTVLERRVQQAERKASDPESFIDELERTAPEREREHAAYLAKVEEWETAHPNRIRIHFGSGSEASIDESISTPLESKPSKSTAPPNVPSSSPSEIVIVRNL